VVGDHGSQRDIGISDENGCIQAAFRFDSLGQEQYTNLLVAATCGNPDVPPGLDRFPEPGEVYMSPALADLRVTDQRIALRYPRLDGIIGREGLTGSNELEAVIGVGAPFSEDLTMRMARFNTFGSAGTDYLATYLRFGQGSLVVLGLMFILLPAVLLIAAGSRLNARTRERQLALLHTIGVPIRTLRLALIYESVLAAGLGSCVGIAVAWVVYPKMTLTFVSWKAFPGDWTVPWAAFPLVLMLVSLTAVAASWLGTRSIGNRQRTAATGGTALRAGRRWTVLLGGLLVAALFTWLPGHPPYPLTGLGKILTAAGIFVVVPSLCSWLGRRCEGSEYAPMSIAGARLRKPAGQLTRALGSLASGLFILSIGVTTVQVFGEDPTALQNYLTQDGVSVIEVRRPSAAIDKILADHDVLSGTFSSGEDPMLVGTLSGPCAVAARITGDDVDCSAKNMYGVSYVGQEVPESVDAEPVTLFGPRASSLSGYTVNFTDRSSVSPGDDIVLIPMAVDDANHLYDQLLGMDPTANVRIDGSENVSGAGELADILGIFRWGSMFVVVFSALAMFIAMLSLLMDRRAANNYLQIVGATPRQVGATLYLEIVVAISGAIGIAFFSSWLWSLTLSDSEVHLSFQALFMPFLIALVTLAAVTGGVAFGVSQPRGLSSVPDRDDLAGPHDSYVPIA